MGLLWGCLLFSLICLSFWNWGYIQFVFFILYSHLQTFYQCSHAYKHIHNLLFFYSFLFALFCVPFFAKSSHAPPKPFFLTHSPNQRTVLSCSSLQMPVTAQSPMVCELKLSAPPLSSANKWTPVYFAVKWPMMDMYVDKCLSVSYPVYEDVCIFTTLSFRIVSLWFSVSGSVSLTVLRSEIWTVYVHVLDLYDIFI